MEKHHSSRKRSKLFKVQLFNVSTIRSRIDTVLNHFHF